MSLSIDQLKRGARAPARAAALTLLLGLGGPASASAAEADLTRSCARYASEGVRVAECVEELRIARDATIKYQDPAVAERDGFVKTDDSTDAAYDGQDPALGAIGEHWVRPDRMADERLDPREPEILLYVNTPTGRRLVAVEWSLQRIERGSELTGGMPYYGLQPPDPSRTVPPPRMFGGKAFDGPMQGHHPHQPWHYDLHVWLWEENAAGIFAHYNRRVSCTEGIAPEGGGGSENGSSPPRGARSMNRKVRRDLARVRRATDRYRNEKLAIADGFRRTDDCVERPAQAGGGAMGYHYVNQARFDRKLDLEKPEALLYRRSATGKRKLAGVEYFLVDEDQDLVTKERPTLFGQALQGPMPGHPEPDHPTNPNWMPAHYDLHVWLWRKNPNGTFARWNPRVKCLRQDG
jgi:hypothetical protein